MATLERIKKLCKERSITVSILEEKLDLPNNTIYQWKTRTPSTDRLEKVADYFNVSVDYLLGRTKEQDIDTIAAHYNGEDWTEDELEEIERFKEFVRLKRKQKGE
ncbi:helix-turn-helix transcriptional regulator [Bacillus sp. Bva_UNVM-123]|uniref:helix-turn-helix domain-containing protein n=1 Tax=Bacillus sp. Bva_UNVM-123 TaxID=2829798 RepID=UPI00391FC1F8